ncbi:Uma2 family endonuclease [Phytohabitans sp. ZYX-F-186]|uniref:Uma2 family endonuclease n=1 Tax=Phytohabitans maris TaxID=3071409 RepID=A0ABU0Z8P4_9ACTN|nr:Uma2 family endonuclease [Phytohabitans sp. ZYX-F-186]MDQ7903424.1 Uma2 family endonuclease [Phytohabitans sp. ZYX-F-186]
MTAALSEIHPPPGGWTTDDLDALPEDGYRRELIDGVLILSPSPTDIHQIIAGRLMVTLEEGCPDDLQVAQGVEVRVSKRRSFIPDVLVTTDAAAQRRTSKYEPHEVVLAVEIVSDGSQTMDRITKPALYAQAGIPYYWRIETENGIVVHTHKIDSADEIYQPTGQFTDVVKIDEPWPISLPVSRITPRHYRAG